jgi:hypothetical protein
MALPKFDGMYSLKTLDDVYCKHQRTLDCTKYEDTN